MEKKCYWIKNWLSSKLMVSSADFWNQFPIGICSIHQALRFMAGSRVQLFRSFQSRTLDCLTLCSYSERWPLLNWQLVSDFVHFVNHRYSCRSNRSITDLDSFGHFIHVFWRNQEIWSYYERESAFQATSACSPSPGFELSGCSWDLGFWSFWESPAR